jgi:hypothetical protein
MASLARTLRLMPRLRPSGSLTVPVRATRPLSTTRSHLIKDNMSATQGQADPGTASNVAASNPIASSAESSAINQSRAQPTGDSNKQASGAAASTAKPVDQGTQSESQPGEEDTGAQEAMKPEEGVSQAEKRRRVEREGSKKLDAADN